MGYEKTRKKKRSTVEATPMMDRDWEAEEDCRACVRAKMVMKDPERKARMIKAAKHMKKEQETRRAEADAMVKMAEHGKK